MHANGTSLLAGGDAGAKTAEPTLACVQVRELLHKRVRDTFLHPQFNTDVMKPLNIESLLDQEVLIPSTVCSPAACCRLLLQSVCDRPLLPGCTFGASCPNSNKLMILTMRYISNSTPAVLDAGVQHICGEITCKPVPH